MTLEAASRRAAADAARLALARGGVEALEALVAEVWIERDRLRRVLRIDRDTEPCSAPEEGGP